jgi:hypothetical protein
MIHHTQTDAKTDTWGNAVTPVTETTATITVRTMPNQWIEIVADLPGVGLEATGVRLRGRVISIEAARPRLAEGLDPLPGIERVTTRITLHERPRGPLTATRREGGNVLVHVPLATDPDAPRASDGIGIIAADRLAAARHSIREPLNVLSQAADVFPQRSGSVSAS